MFIAHLPSGYIVASLSQRRIEKAYATIAFWCILIGSILPDIDMFYFYLIDGRQTNHHLYYTHIPMVWVLLLGGLSVLLSLLKKARWARACIYTMLGVGLHLLLDTPVGGIAWLYPFDRGLLNFIDVPATQSWWVLSFVLHWTFMVELIICAVALYLWINNRRRSRGGARSGNNN